MVGMDKESLINVVLCTPEIPQNTGNIIRLCANVGARLHLIEPLGFQLEDAKLRRAALDYGDLADVEVYESIDDMFMVRNEANVYATVVNSPIAYTDLVFHPGDTIMFGSESSGISSEILSRLPNGHQLSIPMMPANRSLNLSNAVAIVVYEMWRQFNFEGAGARDATGHLYFS
jgi:tRNA (cytidine/uridine-2'-O-)-methyltransferase